MSRPFVTQGNPVHASGLPAAEIRNRADLLSHGDADLRRDVLDIVLAGVQGADPGARTLDLVRLEGDHLHIADRVIDLTEIERLLVIGAGKASLPIAAVLEEILGERISDGLITVKQGETRRLRHIEVLEAEHPLPGENSVEGARRMLALARSAGPRDLVLLVVTGGASALATLPPDGVTLADLRELSDLLLTCGATIREINTVRRHLCGVKGGRLISAVQPAEAVTFTLNTAPQGMPWPDMCLADPSTFADAVAVLEQHHLWDVAAESIRTHLLEGVARPELETVKTLEGMRATIVEVGDAASACVAAASFAARMGYRPTVLSTYIEGEARDVGVCLAGIARQMCEDASPFALPSAIITAGETTVTMRDRQGRGGPNQETALAFAQKFRLAGRVAFAAVDTDGTDGPTDIAGGIVDWTTIERAAELGIDIAAALDTHCSSEALARLGDAIVTGHTGTNVMNLRVLLVKSATRAETGAAAATASAGRPQLGDTIERLDALEVLSGSGRPTVSARLRTRLGVEVHASVPSGTSKGKYEAFELCDGGDRYRGLGVRTAVHNVDTLIAPALVGAPVADQARIDEIMLALDGTDDLRCLGANAILSVSMATARAGARSCGIPLYEHLGGSEVDTLPVPIATMIAGGQHSPSSLDIEDYIVMPSGFSRFSDALEALVETRTVLEELLCARFGAIPDVGGALAPPVADSREAFSTILEAAERAGYGGRMRLGVDVAASAFYDRENDSYALGGSDKSREEVVDFFRALTVEYPLDFIEDAFDEDDFAGFSMMTAALPGHEIVGDDLFVSNVDRIQTGIEKAAGNAVLLKVNQIGTVSGARAAARLAIDNGFSVTVSLRSSDTNDSFIADLAVAVGAKRIKLGSPVRGERNAKYNRLLAIERELGARARLAGTGPDKGHNEA